MRPPSPIHVGAWLVYPELMVAQNTHNGTIARFGQRDDGTWVLWCCNCPADWMLKQLGTWLLNFFGLKPRVRVKASSLPSTERGPL